VADDGVRVLRGCFQKIAGACPIFASSPAFNCCWGTALVVCVQEKMEGPEHRLSRPRRLRTQQQRLRLRWTSG
jgi:hypothetical protein